MKKTFALIASGALLFALAGCTSSPPKGGPSPSAASHPSASGMLVPVTPSERKRESHAAAESLRHLQAEPKKYFATAAKKDIAAHGQKLEDAFPAGSKIVPDESGWNPLTETQAAIDVTQVLANGTKVKYVALMIKEQGTWKFLQTIKTNPSAGAQ